MVFPIKSITLFEVFSSLLNWCPCTKLQLTITDLVNLVKHILVCTAVSILLVCTYYIVNLHQSTYQTKRIEMYMMYIHMQITAELESATDTSQE